MEDAHFLKSNAFTSIKGCFKNSFESNALALKLLCRSTCNIERCHGNNRD